MRNLILYIFLGSFSASALANTFLCKRDFGNIQLNISKDKISLVEGAFKKEIKLNNCKLKLAKNFNRKLLELFYESRLGSIDCGIDGKMKKLAQDSSFAIIFQNIKAKVTALDIAMNSKCK